jgi:hypothetical protein
MANSKRFPGKLTGAKARLLANMCDHYSVWVEDACTDDAYNDTPNEHPIFSWLSPHQRLQLVHEVMVGLLCPDEPLPPETIQHYTTYLALIATIQTAIQVEIGWAENDRLDRAEYDRAEDDYSLDVYDDTTHNDRRIYTSEEREELSRNWDLISRQAEKNKKKIDRAQASTEEAQAGAYVSPVEAFHATGATEPNRLNFAQRISYDLRRISYDLPSLFVGPPISAEARRPLTDYEEGDFWRLLVDDALQEDTHGMNFPLCNVDFDWRCTDIWKWDCAVSVLMIAYHGADITRSEQALVEGVIGTMEYADWSQHARIHAIEKIVKDLRNSYDPFWKPDMLAVDQRAIFADIRSG